MIPEVGDEWLCIKTVVMNGDGSIAYKVGKTYVSELYECITDEQGYKNHTWSEDYGLSKFFKPCKSKNFTSLYNKLK